MGDVAPHNILYPPPKVLGDGGAIGLSQQSGFSSIHLFLKLLEGRLLGIGVDVTEPPVWSLELPDPPSVAPALIDASFSVDALLRFLYYGPLLSSVTQSHRY
ncbi:MAG: hypothetical protein M3151_05515 [Actinomycetota bacterium]|nr:hypothetical protein [Actinomycetota bacterium]